MATLGVRQGSGEVNNLAKVSQTLGFEPDSQVDGYLCQISS